MNEQGRKIDTGTLFWGLALIGVGVLFLLEQTGMADLHSLVRTYWPLILVVLGLGKVFRRQWGGLTLIAVGAWLEAVTLHLWDFTYGSSWPLLVIVIGALMVLRAIVDAFFGHRRDAAPEEPHDQQ